MEGLNNFWKKFANCIVIPQRYLLGVMTGFAILNAYTMRVSLSMAITEMVVKQNESMDNNSDACPIMEEHSYVTVKNTDLLYDWDEMIQGHILGSFFWGYIITHIPGAIIAEKLGAKHVLGVGMILNGFLTLASPTIIQVTRGDWVVLVLLRFVEGLGQGPVYPAVTTILGQWIPAREHGAISSIAYAGALMGTVFTNSLSGVLITAVANWDIVFYFFGSLGLVWNIAWQLLCYSYPRTHPCLKGKEKEYLDKELATHVNTGKLKTPWKAILTSFKVWALIIGQFGHDWGWFTMVTDLPKYMNAVLRFNVQENGFWSSFPYFFMWASTVGAGYLADWVINNKYLKIGMTRKILATVGTMGPAIFMVLASYVGCRRILAVVMFTIALFLMGFYYPGMKINALDLSPNFAGSIMALMNGIGVFAGMAVPVVVGVLAPNQTLSEWRMVFWVSFIVFAVTNVVYVGGMSGEIQPWNESNVPPEEAKE